MERILITPGSEEFPEVFQPLLRGCAVYDSSGHSGCKTFFLDRDGGLFLKKAPVGALRQEAERTSWFHSRGFAAQVLAYESLDEDWLLTVRVPGEDCTNQMYLDDPARLSALWGTLLRRLHETDGTGCPQADRTAEYIRTAQRNRERGHYDIGWYPPAATAEDAWRKVEEIAPLLKNDVLIHGDYCLPNVMLDNWRFTGFIDLAGSGMGDRHIDLFWGAWTLRYNLHTDRYRTRFLNAYGRDRVDEEILAAIAAFEVFE